MKIAFISDLHIKNIGDEAYDAFMSFVRHPDVKNSSSVYFLGDIFDFFIGDHHQFSKKYDFLFKEISALLEEGREVIYLEGNHDFHIGKVFDKYFRENKISTKKFYYKKEGFTLNMGDLKAYICHGDEVDFSNIAFKRWKAIYTSKIFYFLVSIIIPFKLLLLMAEKASKNSKSRGSRTFDFDEARSKYIEGAKNLLEDKATDIIVAGHTHIKEDHTYEDGRRYINCGNPTVDKETYIWCENKFKKIKL